VEEILARIAVELLIALTALAIRQVKKRFTPGGATA
jgi:hypothetical protein